ncbi:MAG: hypothetical protein V4717_03715 [Bacteroidota bacterium]
MQLSDQQIDYLFKFIERKFVYWYDLQIELADHLASHIEAEMDKDPGLLFETAVEKIYQQFGLFGFAKLVQEKQIQVAKAGRKLWWQAVRTFLSWPKFGLLILFAIISWQLTSLFDLWLLMPAFIIVYFISKVALIIKFQKFKERYRRLMLIEAGMGAGFVSFLFDMLLFTGDHYESRLAFCIYFTCGTIILFAFFHVFHSIKKQVTLLYPGALKHLVITNKI